MGLAYTLYKDINFKVIIRAQYRIIFVLYSINCKSHGFK
jgi:hypothetical protein